MSCLVSSEISLEKTSEGRGDLYQGHKFTPTPFERESELWRMYYSDGGIGEILHTLPQKTSRMPLVMVAGFITILDSWEIFLQGVKKEFEVYYLETREKGTFHPPQNYGRSTFTPNRFVRDLVEFIDAAGLEDGQYILAGSSFGGTIMIDALAENLVKPHTAILIGANTHFHIPFPGNIIARIFPAGLFPIFKPMIRWYLRNFMVDRKTDEKQYQKYVKAMELANFRFIKHTVLNYHIHPQEDILPRVRVPTIVVGADLDKMHTIDETTMTVNKIPNAELKTFPTNHDTHSEPFVEYLMEKFR